MDFQRLIEESWSNTLKFIGPVLLLTIVQLIVVTVSLGILAPVTTAGYIHSLLRAAREGRPPEIGDLFSQMRLFLPLSVFFFLVFCAAFLGFLLLIFPGLAVIGFVAFASLYLIPLMTDQKLGLFDALKESWNQATKSPVSEHIIITIIYILIMSLGGILPLAILIAQPIATFFLVGAYQDRVALEGGEQSRIDKQGVQEEPPVPPAPPTPPADPPEPPKPPQPE